MTASVAQAYQELTYPGGVLPQMHPDRMATVATLLGMDPAPAPVDRCRMLELGCGEGASLIPFAFELPQSRFVGIDLTPASIAAAKEQAAALRLANVEFRCMDVLDADASLGEFDYIACHGVYSWVPTPVREKSLELCRMLLAPNGIAYISYNARPGSDLRVMLRNMMLFHIPEQAPATERVRQARALVEFLAEALPDNEIYHRLMEWHRQRLNRLPDALLFHDDLSDVHEPLYFHQFMAQAARRGLQFLGEADFWEMADQRFAPAIREKLAQLGGQVLVREQYMDFLKGRAFRQTLLCREGVRINREITPERFYGLRFATEVEPVSSPVKVAGNEPAEFRAPKGATFETAHPLAKAIFVTLAEAWPGDLPFEELRARVARLVEETSAPALAAGLLEIYCNGPAIEIVQQPHACATRPPERPRLSPVARAQLQAGKPAVSNLRHKSVDARDPLFRAMLLLSDGTRDRAALCDALAAAIEAGKLPALPAEPAASPGESSAPARPLREQIAAGLERNLAATRFAVLIE